MFSKGANTYGDDSSLALYHKIKWELAVSLHKQSLQKLDWQKIEVLNKKHNRSHFVAKVSEPSVDWRSFIHFTLTDRCQDKVGNSNLGLWMNAVLFLSSYPSYHLLGPCPSLSACSESLISFSIDISRALKNSINTNISFIHLYWFEKLITHARLVPVGEMGFRKTKMLQQKDVHPGNVRSV